MLPSFALTLAFLDTCPEASSGEERGVNLEDLHRPGSGTQWKSWMCWGVGGGGVLDQLSSAVEDKWLALLNGRKNVEGWGEGGKGLR